MASDPEFRPDAISDKAAPPYCLDKAFGPRIDQPPHPGFCMAILWCILFLIVTQLVPGIIAVMLAFLWALMSPNKVSPEDIARNAIMPAMIGSQVFSIALSWIVLYLVAGRDWPRQVGLRRPSWTHLGLTVLAFPAVVLFGSGVYALVKELIPSLSKLTGLPGLPDMDEMVKEFGAWPLPLAILIIGVGPGIGEELWCRGFLGRGLVGRYGVVIGIAMTSFLFGLIHVEPRQATMAAFMGVLLHYLYLTTRSLWLPILLHFMNNSLAVVAAHIAVKDESSMWALIDQAPERIPEVLYLGSLVLLAAIGYALYQTRARLQPGEWPVP